MKVLIAISSCEQYERDNLNLPLRETSLFDAVNLGMDYKFFHGTGSIPKEDVVVLDCEDGMCGLTEKLKKKAKWAVEKGYDYIFSCFPDTYMCAQRLLTSGYQNFDYYGRIHQHPGGAPYCQGGPGNFLSKKACIKLYESPMSYLNDDCFAGDILNCPEINRADSREFKYLGPGPLKNNLAITNHLSTQPCGFTAEGMRAEHKRWTDSWL